MGLMGSILKWIRAELFQQRYSLVEGMLIYGSPKRPRDSVPLNDIVVWRTFGEMGFDVVELELAGGGKKRWIDKYDDLLTCLRSSVGDREQCQS